MKLKIGNFARIAQVTVQTLRHYDDLGLLEPVEVDSLSGYRYYVLDQLPRLHRILALKDLGFSLEQVARLLEDDLPPDNLRGMLRLKQSELRRQVDEGLGRLERLEARLRLIDQEEHQPEYEVVIKPVEALQVVSVRDTIPTYWDEGPLWSQLFHQMKQAGVQACGPYLSLYHSAEPEIDVETCAPVPPEAANTPGFVVRTLPAFGSMVSTIHRGSFTGLAGAYAALLKWIDASGYCIAGPDRSIYLRLPQAGQSRQDPSAITEMQVPISRN